MVWTLLRQDRIPLTPLILGAGFSAHFTVCFFLSVLHCLCTKSHTADRTSEKHVCADTCPGQEKGWSNLKDGHALKVPLQRSFPTKMSLRWGHYTTETGRSRAEASWNWADSEHSWCIRLSHKPGDTWLGGHHPAETLSLLQGCLCSAMV